MLGAMTLVGLGPLFLVSCTSGNRDSPVDTNTGSTTSTDSGGQVDSDSGGPGSSADLVAVVGDYNAEARWFVRKTGELWGKQCLLSWFPDQCTAECRMVGFLHDVVDDVDRVTFAYIRPLQRGGESVGGVLTIEPGSPGEVAWDLIELDFDSYLEGIYGGLCAEGSTDSKCRMSNPHAVARTPDDTWLVADTAHDRILIMNIDTGSKNARGVVRSVLDATTISEDIWEGCMGVSNVETWLEGDSVYALMTCRGDAGGGGSMTRRGSLVLWDITDIEDVRRVWRYPEGGYLKAVHHGRVLQGPDGALLVWGHSLGDSVAIDDVKGTVGVARFNTASPPVYLGDGRLPLAVGTLGFVRSVTPLPDGAGLLVADSGCEKISEPCDQTPRLVEVAFPDLEPTGLGGSYSEDHTDQAFFELEVLRTYEGEDLGQPYEADVLSEASLGSALRTDGAVNCSSED